MAAVEYDTRPILKLIQPDEYECSLRPASMEKAKKELNEDPKEKLGCIKALKEWVDQQPHLTFNGDTIMLLSFLRHCKFSQLRTRNMIENYLRAVNTYKEWFYRIDIMEPKIQAVYNSGYILPLPRHLPNGCQIILYRLGIIDPAKRGWDFKDEIRSTAGWGTLMGRDENVQVNGNVFIMDCTGLTLKHLTAFMNNSEMNNWHKAFKGNFPGRFKAFHYYNAGAVFEAMMAMFRPFMLKKHQERIVLHSTAESLHKAVGMEYLPREYLPDDYKGKHQGYCADILDLYKKTVLTEDLRQHVLEFTGKRVGYDESKKIADVPQESFRKLNVD